MKTALSKTHDLLLEAFDYLGTPVFVIDEHKRIVSFNPSITSIFQCSPDDIVGHGIEEFVVSACGKTSDNDSQNGLHISEYLKNSGLNSECCEAVCRRKKGDVFAAQVSVLPFPVENKKFVIVKDISDEKKIQQRASQRTKELSIYNTFAGILTSHINTDRIMAECVDMLFLIMGADAGWIYLIDDAAGELYLKIHKGFPEDFVKKVMRFKPGECFNGKVFTSGRPLLVRKASEDPRICHKDAEIESIVGVPLISKGINLGVLGLASKKPSYFSSMDIQILATIGSQLAVAIENAGLIGQLSEKMKEIELINELSSMVNSSLSIGTVFRIMMSEIGKLVRFERGSILIYDERDNKMTIFALDTNINTVLKKGMKAPLDTTSAGWVIKNNRPWINTDLSAETVFSLDKKLLDEGIRSTISIPLFQDRMLGVFNLDSTEPSRYSEKDLEILLPVAKHISIALENALLFEEISREKKEWQKTFDAITDMVWVEDGNQYVINANKTLLMKAGLASFQVSGKRCREILDRIGINPAECFCADTISTKKPSFREIKGNLGNIFHFWTYPLVDEEGLLYAIVHYLKDVTSQKRLEQQLVRSDKLASLGTLVAGIAHEINNPLGIIAGYSEALLDRTKNKSLEIHKGFEDFPEYLETIHNEIFRCKDILMSLLDFARPSSGTIREIDINELIKEVILLVNYRAKRLNHDIRLDLNRDLPKILADPGNLRQLFMNIIINSMYFTPEGGSVIIRSALNRAPDGRNVIRVSITDTGTGISDDIIEKIFDPFFTTKPVGDGTGLGLSICHKIIEEHAGDITVESEPGKGTTFIIRLPAK
jgi:two-component system NtrC family sensor kinase